MSLFGSLYVGTSGLQTSQNALNTVAHNMVNADTEGYTRQQVSQATRSYNTISKTNSAISYQQVGLGVFYSEVKQVRDYFLDKSYRTETGRAGFYDISCEAIEEVEKIFQELDGEAFADTLNNLWESVQELAKDPSNTVNQGIFVQRCSEFITRSNAVYEDLESYQNDLNFNVKQTTDRINELGESIVSLNEQILKVEAGKSENANDLRDQRNLYIDELANLAKISVDTDVDGNYIIQIEGVDFVTTGDCKTISLYENPTTGFYTPYWDELAEKDANDEVIPALLNKAKVFNLDTTISTDMATDIGKLKSLLLARGDHRATFEDVKDLDSYKKIENSVVMNVMAEFDALVHDITTGINEIISDAANDADPAKTPNGYLRDENGEPYKIFDVASKEKSIKSGKAEDDYTTSNIIINGTIKQSPSLLGFIRADGIADQSCADSLKTLFTDTKYVLNPSTKTNVNLNNFYNSLISQVSNSGYVMRGISANQEITVSNIANSREQILGVSTDEELSNMIMYQNAFNASSRYINVVSELMEHILNTLGV